MPLPIIHLDGEPYDQGHQHGTALRDQIGHNLDVYYDRFHVRGSSRPTRPVPARPLSAAAGRTIRTSTPCAAWPTGSGQALIDVLVLNVRYELLYYQYGVCGVGGADGCTSFAVLPPARPTVTCCSARTGTGFPGSRAPCSTPANPTACETLGFTEAGIVGGKIGLNSAGLWAGDQRADVDHGRLVAAGAAVPRPLLRDPAPAQI